MHYRKHAIKCKQDYTYGDCYVSEPVHGIYIHSTVHSKRYVRSYNYKPQLRSFSLPIPQVLHIHKSGWLKEIESHGSVQ